MAYEPRSTIEAAQRSDAASATTLLNRLLDDATALVRNEVQLAKAELMDSVRTIKVTVTSMAAGGFVLLTAVLALVAAAILGLAEVIAPWLAALLVGVVLAVIGLVMIQGARKKLADVTLKLDRTTESLRKDAAVAARRT